MSWQANELFVLGIKRMPNDHHQEWEGMKQLLYMYEAHGNGWYLLGYMDDEWDPDEFDEPPHWDKGWDYAWLPNPFMKPGLLAMRVNRPSDLVDVAFECWDNHCDTIAYAGDGDEPLQHIVIRGGEYDMRAA